MNNVAALFGKASRKTISAPSTQWKLPEQLIGIEIEVEDIEGTVFPDGNIYPFWSRIRDGSLRSGNEYILVSPLKGSTLAKAIAEIFHGSVFKRSTTGSTHIHVDMLEDETSPEIVKVLTLIVYALENTVFSILGNGREWSGYTNKLASAPESLIGRALNASESNNYAELLTLTQDSHGVGRYYGLNLAALAKYGSVEFRYFPTATSPEELTNWVQMMQSFKKAACEVGTIEKLTEIFSNEDLYQNFITTYFEEWSEAFLLSSPHYIAHAMVKKALMVADTYKMQQQAPFKFNRKAITDNRKIVEKFAKKIMTDVPSNDAVFLTPLDAARAPSAADLPDGSCMYYSRSIYVAVSGAWRGPPFPLLSLEGARIAKQKLLDTGPYVLAELNASRGNLYTSSYISQYQSIRDVAINYLDQVIANHRRRAAANVNNIDISDMAATTVGIMADSDSPEMQASMDQYRAVFPSITQPPPEPAEEYSYTSYFTEDSASPASPPRPPRPVTTSNLRRTRN